jgi:hypothetical protein
MPGINPAATIYADSAAGNDASNGLTPLTPKKTLAAVRGLSPGATSVIALKRGSKWRESLYGLPAGCSVIAYGVGAPPLIDSSDVATGWTATAGRTNVHEIAWTRDVSSGSGHTGIDYILLWENDVQLAGAASVAACESAPGSFYHDEVAAKVYYHPTGSAATSTKFVEITKRPEGIYQYPAGIAINGIRTRRSWAHYGTLSNGAGGAVRNSILEGGGIHHAVVASGTFRDVVFLETSPRHTGGTIPIAVYQPNGVGANPALTRLFMIGTPAMRPLQGALYSHTSNDPATSYDSMTYEQCYVSYGAGFNANATGAYTLSNSFVENGSMGISLSTGTPTIARTLFKDCIGSATSGAVISDAGPIDTTNRTRTVANSVIYISDSSSTGANYGARVTPRQGSITFTNCVIYLNTPNRSMAGVWAASNGAGNQLAITMNNCVVLVPRGGAAALYFQDSNVTYSGDHNVFIRADSSKSAIPFRWNNAYLEGLTNWRAASGQDAHSVYLSATQQATFWSGNVATGDFRINASNAVTDADGTTYTGEFPDGMPLSTAGVQEHFNWNTRSVEAGPPTKWPVPPQTLAQAESYVLNPMGWDFYP